MKENFKQAVKIVLGIEGGHADNDDDPGGETKFGISRRAHPGLDIAGLTKKDAEKIYRADYWDACRCDDLPGGLDLLVFDTAVNQGPLFARRTLQQAARVTVDGIIGPQTMAGVNRSDAGQMVAGFTALRTHRYARTKNFNVFGMGWMRRAANVHQAAVQLVPEFNKKEEL